MRQPTIHGDRPEKPVIQVDISPMQTGDNDARVGLAIGVFDKFASLESALADLIHNGFNQNRLCVLGLPSALQTEVSFKRAGEADETVLLSLLSRLEERRLPPAGPVVLASSGPALDALSGSRPAKDRGSGQLDLNRLSQFSGSLGNHLASGAIALVIHATCATRQDLSARILLRHATLGMFTHEFVSSAKTGIEC